MPRQLWLTYLGNCGLNVGLDSIPGVGCKFDHIKLKSQAKNDSRNNINTDETLTKNNNVTCVLIGHFGILNYLLCNIYMKFYEAALWSTVIDNCLSQSYGYPGSLVSNPLLF